MRFAAIVAMALWVSCGAPGPVLAQVGLQFDVPEEPSDAPVEVESDALMVDRDTGKAVFTGNVKVTQEDMFLGAEEVIVTYDEVGDKVTLIEAQRSVVYTSPSEDAESDWARYDPEADFLIMGGNVLLIQGNNVMNGDNLEVNMISGEASLSGRVRSVFGKRD